MYEKFKTKDFPQRIGSALFLTALMFLSYSNGPIHAFITGENQMSIEINKLLKNP